MNDFNWSGPFRHGRQVETIIPGEEPRTARMIRSLVIAPVSCLMVGGVFVGLDRLWFEWKSFDRERASGRESAYVGYQNIQPRFLGIDPPRMWFIEEGDSIRLWSGRPSRRGNEWFRLKKGEIDRSRLSGVLGKEVVPTIDRPLVEIGDGARWRRLSEDTKVVGLQLNGMDCVYPFLLLEKVEAVNDLVWGRPFLVTFSPVAKPEESVEVFAPLIGGKRVTMGMSGYFLDGEPIFFDRATESLWIRDVEGLKAISGELKGAVLKRVARPESVAWDVWRSAHPQSRLIVGAEQLADRRSPAVEH